VGVAHFGDWLYVEDYCAAIDLILHTGKEGEVYDIGGHNEKSNLEVVKKILLELGKSENLFTFFNDRVGHDMRYAINPSKIKMQLGWEPITKFDEGIKITVKWYVDNSSWWGNIISADYKNYYENMYG